MPGMSQPLIILADDRADTSVQALLACNEKSRTKTLEQGELWYLDPSNGRVLPYRGGGVSAAGFVERGGWWEVRVGSLAPRGSAEAAPSSSASGTSPAAATSLRPRAEPEPGAAHDILARLGDLIAERHRSMPEGSYTTHLFSRGSGKIRKKLGEEAVETILAATPEELRSEAADLIYHLMVLLEAEGQRLEAVLAELDKRHRGE